MSEIHVTAERFIDAPPERVYACIADYRTHHPHFLPPTFSDFEVEQGGVGAGTVIRFVVNRGTRSRVNRMRVDEPEPGRVLTESDLGSSLVTTFTVDPEGSGSRVRMETRWQGTGVSGLLQRLLAQRVLRRVYLDELDRLARYVVELPKA